MSLCHKNLLIAVTIVIWFPDQRKLKAIDHDYSPICAGHLKLK